MNAFVDTNIIIDLLAKRDPFYKESIQLFSLADSHELNITISALSIVNTHYVLSEVMKVKNTRSVLNTFKVLVNTHQLTDKIVDLALTDLNFKDFEDCIQYHTAVESQCEVIVTRDLKGFKSSSIAVLSPKEFLAKWRML